MDRRDSSRGPPPPPEFYSSGPHARGRGGGPREYPSARERRPRSHSPPPGPTYRGGRGSPDYKRGRRDDDFHYERVPAGGAPYDYRSGHRASPPPPPRGYDESSRSYYRDAPPPPPRGPPDHRELHALHHHSRPDDSTRPMSFKEFMIQQQDDPSVEEAQRRYEAYTIEWHGGAMKANFAKRKDDEGLRAQFDPRMFEKALAKRAEEAKEAAAAFIADLQAGKLDPTAPDFNQGALELASVAKISAPVAATDAPASIPTPMDTDALATTDVAVTATPASEPALNESSVAASMPTESAGEADKAATSGSEPVAAVATATAVPQGKGAEGIKAEEVTATGEPANKAEAPLISGPTVVKADALNIGTLATVSSASLDRHGSSAAGAAAVPEPAAVGPPAALTASVPLVPPALCWRPVRVNRDLELSLQLTRKLDTEKGITDNPLPGIAADGAAAAAEVAVAPATATAAAHGDAAMTEAKPANGDGTSASVAVTEAPAQVNAAATTAEKLAENLGRLDLQLTWLWRVHGIDYYAGHELAAAEYGPHLTTCRTLRGPAPEDLAAVDAEAASAEAQLAKRVDSCWAQRIKDGDPLEARCQRSRVEDAVEKWIESQIIMAGDNKWGSKLSQKMFVGRKFVIKHIRVKHDDKICEVKDKVYDDIYWENYKAAKEEEEKRKNEGAERVEDAGADAVGGGRGRGRQRRGARGPTRRPMQMEAMGGMMEGGLMEMPMGVMPMPMGVMPMAMGGMMQMGAPMGFIPAPGAGPMGPFIPMNMMGGMGAMGAMGGMSGFAPAMGARRMQGGPGRGRGGQRGGGTSGYGYGPGAKLDPQGIREYYDLDDPGNNRAVLDYGDL